MRTLFRLKQMRLFMFWKIQVEYVQQVEMGNFQKIIQSWKILHFSNFVFAQFKLHLFFTSIPLNIDSFKSSSLTALSLETLYERYHLIHVPRVQFLSLTANMVQKYWYFLLFYIKRSWIFRGELTTNVIL